MQSFNIMKFGYIYIHRITYVSIQHPIQHISYIHPSISLYIYIHISTNTSYRYTCPHAHLHFNEYSLDTYSFTSMYVSMYSQVSIYTFIVILQMHTSIFVYTHLCIHMHTSLHPFVYTYHIV